MLKTKDLFIMAKIFKKMELKDHLQKLLETSNLKENKDKKTNVIEDIQKKKGAELLGLVIENIDKVEEEIYQLVASFSDTTIEIVREQDPTITIDIVNQIFRSDVFQSFFRQAVR